MKTIDMEPLQVEMIKNVPLTRIQFYGSFFGCIKVRNQIKNIKNWINSSGKNDPTPDFYSEKYKLMMDAMAINDVEYEKNGKIINNQKRRQHEML